MKYWRRLKACPTTNVRHDLGQIAIIKRFNTYISGITIYRNCISILDSSVTCVEFCVVDTQSWAIVQTSQTQNAPNWSILSRWWWSWTILVTMVVRASLSVCHTTTLPLLTTCLVKTETSPIPKVPNRSTKKIADGPRQQLILPYSLIIPYIIMCCTWWTWLSSEALLQANILASVLMGQIRHISWLISKFQEHCWHTCSLVWQLKAPS